MSAMDVGNGLQVERGQSKQEVSLGEDNCPGGRSTGTGTFTWGCLGLGSITREGETNREGQETAVTTSHVIDAIGVGEMHSRRRCEMI